MGRYYTSEALRNKKLQQKAIDYALNQAKPILNKVGKEALNKLSTKIRPNKKYKTDRKDLDGAGIIDKALKSGVAGSPWQVDYKTGLKLLTDPGLFKGPSSSKEQMKDMVKRYKQMYKQAKESGYEGSYNKFVKEIGVASSPTFTFPGFGGALDIHKAIGKLPKPKSGWTPGKYKYMGPYNPLDQQLEYDRNTGEVTKWHVQPYNKVDEIAAHHDICYDMGKNKGECDKQMVKSLDMIPYGQMPKWGQTARFLINTKQKLGLGVKERKTKNGKGRRVKKKTGKKN